MSSLSVKTEMSPRASAGTSPAPKSPLLRPPTLGTRLSLNQVQEKERNVTGKMMGLISCISGLVCVENILLSIAFFSGDFSSENRAMLTTAKVVALSLSALFAFTTFYCSKIWWNNRYPKGCCPSHHTKASVSSPLISPSSKETLTREGLGSIPSV